MNEKYVSLHNVLSEQNNDLVTKEDIRDHIGVSALIQKDEKFLVFKHVKYGFWTIPVGKADLKENPEQAIKREVQEEVGIKILKMKLILSFQKRYDRGNGVFTNVKHRIYYVQNFLGTCKNMEPHKHSEMKWMTFEELKSLTDVSDATKASVKWIEDTMR